MFLLIGFKSPIIIITLIITFVYSKVIDYGIFKEMDLTSHVMHKYITYNTDNYTTLCWADILVTNSFHNGSETNHHEYAIILLSSVDIPKDYLRHESAIHNVEYSEEGDTKKSRVFNFTSTNVTKHGIVTEYTNLLCGSGPVLTKDYIDLNLKKRFEIRVAPAWKMEPSKQYISSDNGTIPDGVNVNKTTHEVSKEQFITSSSEKLAQANFDRKEDSFAIKDMISDEIRDFLGPSDDNKENEGENQILGDGRQVHSSEDNNDKSSVEFDDSNEFFTPSYSTFNTLNEMPTTQTNFILDEKAYRNCSSRNCNQDGANLSLINVQIFNIFNNNASNDFIERLNNNSGNLSYNNENFTNSYINLNPFLNPSMVISKSDSNYTSFLDELLDKYNFYNNGAKRCNVNCDNS